MQTTTGVVFTKFSLIQFKKLRRVSGEQISRRRFPGSCPLKLSLPYYNFFLQGIRALWLCPRSNVFAICSKNLFSWCVFHALFFSAVCCNKMHSKHIPTIEPTLNSDTHLDTDHNQNDCNGNGNAHHGNDNIHELMVRKHEIDPDHHFRCQKRFTKEYFCF